MVPLYGFISAREYEAILVHRFSILSRDYVCVDAAKEIEKWLREPQNKVKNLSSVLRFNVEIHLCCMWRLFIFQKCSNSNRSQSSFTVLEAGLEGC